MLRLALILLLLPVAGAAADCRETRFDGAGFTLCEVDLERETLRLWLDDAEGRPYGSFRAVDEALADGDRRLGVAMNAGMYHDDRSPVGHYVEEGAERMRVITSEGPGNFGLLPNGIFCLGKGRAAVIESRVFAADPPACEFATQSGPMLVIDGELHPRFLPDSTSLHRRNGVGVADGGRTVWLAISDEPVNFHLFARLFRDALGVREALYFDGNVSRLYDPASGRHDGGFPMGPIVGTVEPR